MIKNHLSKLLGERRWTQADLARKTGIRRATINELYNELTDRVNLEHLDRICEVLECSAVSYTHLDVYKRQVVLSECYHLHGRSQQQSLRPRQF